MRTGDGGDVKEDNGVGATGCCHSAALQQRTAWQGKAYEVTAILVQPQATKGNPNDPTCSDSLDGAQPGCSRLPLPLLSKMLAK